MGHELHTTTRYLSTSYKTNPNPNLIMPLIKVRGKRAKPQAAGQTHNNSNGSSSLPTHQPTDMPLLSWHDPSRTTSSHLSKNPSGKPSASKCSRLESLPTELLELIFFDCLNISLPRASLALGRALSSFHVKSHLMERLFSSDHTQRLGRHSEHAAELLEIFSTLEAVSNLQTDVLALKWMDWDFLREYMPKELGRKLLTFFKAEGLDWMDGTSSKDLNFEFMDRLMKEYFRLAESPNEIIDDTWHSNRWRTRDSRMVKLQLNPLGLRYLVMVHRNECIFPYILHQPLLLLSHGGCLIPEKLLRGPWTDEKCQMLDIVRRSRAMVDWINSTRGEVAMQGLHSALQESNLRAIRLLTNGKHRGRSPSPQSANQGSPEPQDVNKPDTEYAITTARTEHLRTAVIDLGCSLDVVKCLLRPPNDQIDFDDPALLSWAVRERSEGNPRGDWLLRTMREAADKRLNLRR